MCLCLCPPASPINLPLWTFAVLWFMLCYISSPSNLQKLLLQMLSHLLESSTPDEPAGRTDRWHQIKANVPVSSHHSIPILRLSPSRKTRALVEAHPNYCMCGFNKHNIMSHLTVLEAAGAPLKHNQFKSHADATPHQGTSLILSGSDPHAHQSLFHCLQRCIYL